MPDRRIIFVKLGCNLLQLVIHFQKILNIKRIFRNSEVRSPLQKCHKFLRTVKMDTAEKLKIHRYRHIDDTNAAANLPACTLFSSNTSYTITEKTIG